MSWPLHAEVGQPLTAKGQLLRNVSIMLTRGGPEARLARCLKSPESFRPNCRGGWRLRRNWTNCRITPVDHAEGLASDPSASSLNEVSKDIHSSSAIWPRAKPVSIAESSQSYDQHLAGNPLYTLPGARVLRYVSILLLQSRSVRILLRIHSHICH